MVEMKVEGLTLDPLTNMPIIILKDLAGDKALPIWVGYFEANAIALEIEKINTPRPMTHDLLNNIISSLQAKVKHILVTDLKDNTFTVGKTKNHEGLKLPLTWILLEVLERRKNDNGNPYVFEGDKPNSHLSPPKKQIEKARELVGFHFTNHDLRRTFSTTAHRLNFGKYTLDRLINHKTEDSRDVTARYVILDVEDLREPMNQITESIWSQIQ